MKTNESYLKCMYVKTLPHIGKSMLVNSSYWATTQTAWWFWIPQMSNSDKKMFSSAVLCKTWRWWNENI